MATLDMTIMFAFHDALRHGVEQVARRAAAPEARLDSALGWELFSTYLQLHHTAEDDLLWPMLVAALDGRDDDRALVDSLEAEHAQIDPLLDAVGAAFRGESGEAPADVVDALATALTSHLRHEESEGLPLIGRVLTEEQWAQFGQGAGGRIMPDAARCVPWLLAGATDAEALLEKLPPPFREGYLRQWRDSFAHLDLWP